MVNSRTKGASAERELFKLISEALGVEVKRNLVQTREGGYDTKVGGFALEVKRVEQPDFTSWWNQAVKQADLAKLMPMLAYRRSRQPWRVRVYATHYLLMYDVIRPTGAVLDMDLDEAIVIIKKSIEGEKDASKPE
jgi:hypothetical protein